jgi:hypothetical protein
MYRLADGTMSTDYKVGDKFVVVQVAAYFQRGDIITLTEDDMTKCPLFGAGENPCHWSKLEAYKPQFTKSDLKDGMVVTYRNEEKRILIGGEFYEKVDSNWNSTSSIGRYYKDLLRDGSRNLDIMKVEYMDKVLWEREEEETPEQKEIKRLQGIIKEAQDALNVINTGNK